VRSIANFVFHHTKNSERNQWRWFSARLVRHIVLPAKRQDWRDDNIGNRISGLACSGDAPPRSFQGPRRREPVGRRRIPIAGEQVGVHQQASQNGSDLCFWDIFRQGESDKSLYSQPQPLRLFSPFSVFEAFMACIAKRESHHLEGSFDFCCGRRRSPDSLAIPRQPQGSASHPKNESVPHPRCHEQCTGFPFDLMVSFPVGTTSGRFIL